MRRELTGVKKGFTLVELSLSLVFIAILSLTVAFIINDTVASYRRGVTLKQINTVGMDLVDDMRAAIQNSSTKSVVDDCKIIYNGGVMNKELEECEKNRGKSFVSIHKTGNVDLKNGNKLENIQLGGAFCTGTYSYIWNSGYFDSESVKTEWVTSTEKIKFKFKFSGTDVNNGVCTSEGKSVTCQDFRLLKVRDESRAVCMAAAGKEYNETINGNEIDITGSNEKDVAPIDLLASDERNGGLAIYDFNVSGPAESMSHNASFYAVTFVLGTVQGGANITKAGNFCATPDDYSIENFDYCAINKFNFAAQAAGE